MKNDDPLASFRLDDRLIVVTGASQGIGRYLAEGYAGAGAVVVLASRRADKLEEVRASIAARGGRAKVVPTDVSRLDDVAALADAAV
jgi:7-alpha-hydroxysteroid dehydrogenase